MDNEKLTNEIINKLKNKLDKKYKNEFTKRDAHSKSLGLLKAEFDVGELDKQYRVGIFKNPKKYKCLIRVSNSLTEKDNKKDARGFSIKVLGVEGDKVLNDEKHTQDFVLISCETMPIGNLKLFHHAIVSPLKLMKTILTENKLYIIKDLLNIRKHHTNVLNINYFSTTPYMFSDKIVKYKIEPSKKNNMIFSNNLTENSLSENMQTYLKNNGASFDFMVQFRTNPSTMPVNDASISWKDSKYIKLATINIKPQEFKTKQRKALSELLSFSPGHSLKEHKPIGDINKARIKIYLEMSNFRHKKNSLKLFEPDEKYFDNLK